ncbi:hypothetical protein ARAF_1443 [Arsenophonus endosymbiont of Aleurodicus floccissimus]|nr:hypothetical protein ARAF_1443 [Arsenophonus endosymbiont of Aleurodicus floccissimus]
MNRHLELKSFGNVENSGTIEIIDTSLVLTLVEDAINIDAINDNSKIISVRDLTVDIVIFC